MLLEINKKKFTKSPRIIFYDMPIDEVRLLALLSSTYFYKYDEIKKFVYSDQIIPKDLVHKKVWLMENKYNLAIAINDYGARLRSKIYIKE